MNRTMVALLTLTALALVGCDTGDGMNGPRNDGEVDLFGEAFAVVGAEDAFAYVGDATLDRMMTMSPVMHDGRLTRHDGHSGETGSHLAPILTRLELDREQRVAVYEAMQKHRRQVHPALEGLREVNAIIIERANAAREAILAAYEAGEITREQAARRIHTLSERTREAIRDNPDNAPYLRMLCRAHLDLFETIREILTDPQRRQWDRWVDSLDGRCFGD